MSSKTQPSGHLATANRMFHNRGVGYNKPVETGVIGRIRFWDAKKSKGFGFIESRDGREFYCHASSFLTHCGVNDVVKFDVEESFKKNIFQTGKEIGIHQLEEQCSYKAVNVALHQPAFSSFASDLVGTVVRRGIRAEDGEWYACNSTEFRFGDRVRFDIITDNWTGNLRADNVRNTLDLYLSGVEGKVVKMSRSYGFISTDICKKDLYFNWTELMERNIAYHSSIVCDVMMDADGALSAANIRLWTPATPVAMEEPVVTKALGVDDNDCASTSASTEPEAKVEQITPEMRRLLKKLREINTLEGKQALDPLQQAKVAMKEEYQKLLKRLTA